MKKTLIALLAMVGTAFGADTISAAWDTTYAEPASSFWSFTFTLDSEYSIASSGSVLGAFWGTDATSEKGATAIYLTETDGALTLNVGVGSLNNTVLDSTTSFTAASVVTYSGAIETGKKYFIKPWVLTNGTAAIYEFTIDGADSDGSWSPVNYNSAMTDYTETVGYGVNKGSVAGSGALIPEPTTATLSLLALVGLAARRRRK